MRGVRFELVKDFRHGMVQTSINAASLILLVSAMAAAFISI